MKKKLYSNRSLVLAVVAALMLASLVAVMAACNRANFVDGDILSLYDIVADFDAETNTLSCRQQVYYINREKDTLTELKFHLSANAFREGALYPPYSSVEKNSFFYNGVNYGGIDVAKVAVEGADTEFSVGGEDLNVLCVEIPALAPNKALNVEMTYSVKIPECIGRMGVNKYVVNLGNFYPVMCVYENGAYEEHPYFRMGDPFYTDSADYFVTLSFPESYTAAASGTVEESYVENGVKTLEISSPKTRDFAAALSKNFSVISDKADRVDVNYYYFSDENPQFALQTAVSALEVFSQAYGAYPYGTYNVVQTELDAGGMEYTGLILATKTANSEIYEEIIVHETAHQWWYGVVGGNQIKYPWLDEALAEFSTAYYFRLRGDAQRYDKIVSSTASSYILCCDYLEKFNAGADLSSDMRRSIDQYTTESEYIIMNYYKGLLMYTTLLNMYGEKKINKALNTYFTENAYAIAEPEELIEAMDSVCRGSGKIINSWLDGTVIIG